MKNKHMIKEQKSNWKIKVRPNHPSISSSFFFWTAKKLIIISIRIQWLSHLSHSIMLSLGFLYFLMYCGYIYVEKAKRIILMWRTNPKGYEYKMKW